MNYNQQSQVLSVPWRSCPNNFVRKSLQKCGIDRVVMPAVISLVAASIWITVGSQALFGAPQYIPPTPVNNSLTPAQAKEYMESTSPLKSGGSVTHRYSPQSGWQRAFAPGQSPNSLGQNPNIAGQNSGPLGANPGLPSVLRAGGDSGGGSGQSTATESTNVVSNPILPWETSGRVSQLPAEQYSNPATPVVNLPIDPWRATPQAPTLGIPPVNRTQSAWRSGAVIARPNPAVNYVPYQAFSIGPGQLPQTANPVFANTVPQLGSPAVGTPPLVTNATGGGPVFIPPTATYTIPGYNAAATNSPYRPVVRLQNLPPGTYVGQGIIGQPKAYVDGQPMRNLFRYILP